MKRDNSMTNTSSRANVAASATAASSSSSSSSQQDAIAAAMGSSSANPYRYLDATTAAAAAAARANLLGGGGGSNAPGTPGDRSAYLQTLLDLAKAREHQQQQRGGAGLAGLTYASSLTGGGGGAGAGGFHDALASLEGISDPTLTGSGEFQRLSATLSNLGYGGGTSSLPGQVLPSNDSLLLAMEVLKQQQHQHDPLSNRNAVDHHASRPEVLEALQRLEHQNVASLSEAAALRNIGMLGRSTLKEALEASSNPMADYAAASSSDRSLALEIFRQQQQLQQVNQDASRSFLATSALADRARSLSQGGGMGNNPDVLNTLRLLGQQTSSDASAALALQNNANLLSRAGLRDAPDLPASSQAAAASALTSIDYANASPLERSLAMEMLKQKQQHLQEQSRAFSANAFAQRARLVGNAGLAGAPAGSDVFAALQMMGQQRGTSDSFAGMDMAAATTGNLNRRSGPSEEASASLARTGPRVSERASLDLSLCKTSSDTVRVLKVLGSTIRGKDDPFVDVDALPDLKHPYSEYKAPICGDLLFPDKLHILLEDAEREGFSDVVSWLGHKRAFRVHNKARFLAEVMPRHFKGKGVWSSFRRQLNLYGFARTKKGIDAGSYYHELFLHGRKELSQFMFRVGRPRPGLDRRASSKLVEGDDPDFYSLPALKDRSAAGASTGTTAASNTEEMQS